MLMTGARCLLLLLLLPVAEPAVATGMSAEPPGGSRAEAPRAARCATMRVLLRVVVVVVVVLLGCHAGLLLLRRGSRLLRVPRSRRRPNRGGWTLPRGRR